MLLAFAVLVLNVVFMPYLLAAAVPCVLLFLFIRHYYLKTAREIKRLEAISKFRPLQVVCVYFIIYLIMFYRVQAIVLYTGADKSKRCLKTMAKIDGKISKQICSKCRRVMRDEIWGELKLNSRGGFCQNFT